MKKFPVPTLKTFKAADGTVVDIGQILGAPYEDIGEAASVIPPHIGWFGYLRALANEKIIINKHKIKEAEATAYFALRGGEFVSRGFGEKITEAALEHAVNIDHGVVAAVAALAAVERDYDRYSSVIEAMKAKFELVRSSETTRRMEHEPDRK